MQADLPTITTHQALVTNEKPTSVNTMEVVFMKESARSDDIEETSSEDLNIIVEAKSHANALGLITPQSNKHLVETVESNGNHPREVSERILDIIFDYALNKFDDSKDRLAAGAANFLSVIDKFVAAGTRVEACLPAFPFKSANKVYKVLGTLPDKAEELALERLNAMCVRIREVYTPGAQVTIISDGITYNGTSKVN